MITTVASTSSAPERTLSTKAFSAITVAEVVSQVPKLSLLRTRKVSAALANSGCRPARSSASAADAVTSSCPLMP